MTEMKSNSYPITLSGNSFKNSTGDLEVRYILIHKVRLVFVYIFEDEIFDYFAKSKLTTMTYTKSYHEHSFRYVIELNAISNVIEI